MDGPSKKIRIGEAAAAIGTTAKAVRHWISRYGDKGLTPTAEQTGTWLEFSWGDVAALSITKYLVNLGMPSYGAFAIAMGIVEKRWPSLFVDEPSWTVDGENAPMFFYFTRNGEWGFGSFEHAGALTIDDTSRAIVIVLLAGVIGDAFLALKDMGHTLPKCDTSAIDAMRAARAGKNNIVDIKKGS